MTYWNTWEERGHTMDRGLSRELLDTANQMIFFYGFMIFCAKLMHFYRTCQLLLNSLIPPCAEEAPF